MVLTRYTMELFEKRKIVLKKVQDPPTDPTKAAILQTGNCKSCCAEFGKLGPICDHCKRGQEVTAYGNHLYCYRRRVGIMNVISSSDNHITNQDLLGEEMVLNAVDRY